MRYNAAIKRIVAVWITIIAIISTMCMSSDIPMLAASASTTTVQATDGALLFTGFSLEHVPSDNSIRALVSVYLKDYDAVGVGYTLDYDPNYLEPSYYDDTLDHSKNEIITDTADAILSFNQNTSVFPKGNDGNQDYDYLYSDGSALDRVNSTITHHIMPHPDTPLSSYIGYPSYQGGTISIPIKSILAKDRSEPLLLGTMSFKVKVPYQFANIQDASTLQSVLKVHDNGTNEEAQILYVDENMNLVPIGALPINWEVNRQLSTVRPTISQSEVSAYSIYNRSNNAGTLDDLFTYLNQTMSNIMKTYTDLTQEIEIITWDKSLATVTIDGTGAAVDDSSGYDPQGGLTYVISQPYGTTGLSYEVKVTVTRSTLTGFNYERRVKTYEENSRPTVWSELLLPNPIIPIVTGVDDTFIPTMYQDEPTGSDWETTDWTPNSVTSALSTDTPPQSETYTRTVPQTIFGASLPAWLTLASANVWEVDAIRNVLAFYTPPSGTIYGTPNPSVTARVDRETGALIISVTKDAFGAVSAGTDFTVYLPDGTALSSTDALVTVYTDTDTVPTGDTIPSDGAVIVVYMYDPSVSSTDTTLTNTDRNTYQSIINLGSEDFSISKVEYDSPYIESDQLGFSFDPRDNYYLWEYEDNGIKYDEKDYSEGKAGMFPVYEGQALSSIAKYIVFPDNSTIPVAYNGQSGLQPDAYTYPNSTDTNKVSNLAMAKVESWEIEGDSSATILPAQDTTLTLIGKLADTTYTNFGYVSNSTEEVYLKLKVTTLGAPASPTPTPTPDPNATPAPTSGPDTSPTPTPVPGKSIRISTVTSGGTYVNGVASGGPEVELVSNSVFEYDKKKVDYTDYQNQIFKIENNGSDNLSALALDITDIKRYTDSTLADEVTPALQSFKLGYNQVYSITSAGAITPHVTTLSPGSSLFFDIRNLLQLPVGVYTAKVYIDAADTSSHLGEFEISFEVTADDVYTVEVDNTQYPTIGIGYLKHDADGMTRICSNTYAVGDKVYLHVDILDSGYEFNEWQIPSGRATTVTFDDKLEKDTFFFMVQPDPADTDGIVKVEPAYQETNDVWIRLTDLHDYNPDTTENGLRDPIPPYPLRTSAPIFNEQQLNYRTIVDGTVSENYITFDVKEGLLYPASTPPDAMEVSATLDGNPLNITSKGQGSGTSVTSGGNTFPTTQFESDVFSISEGPNIIRITTKYVDENNKTYTKVYTLTIYRKKAVDVELVPGNSPYGLIEGSFTTDAEKAAAKAHFDTNLTFKKSDTNANEYILDSALTPLRAVNTYETHYFDGAWKTKNYDKDPTALFVYQGEQFVDPGFADLKDMDGNAVSAADVNRTIEKVNEITGTVTNISELEDDTRMTQHDVAVIGKGESVVIDELASLKIRPGVYTLKYSFTDADGSAASFTRPVIVLAKKGELNVGLPGWTTANSDLLYQRLSNNLYDDMITSDEEWKRLYAYRIGDVTEDENVNSIDANAVLNNTSATLPRRVMTEYYEPLPQSISDPWPTLDPLALPQPASDTPVPTATPMPVLVLDYLGKAEVPLSAATDPNLSESDVYDMTNTSVMNNKGIVWVGVGVKNVENLEYFLDGLYSMDFGIDYDPNLFEPCDKNILTKSDPSKTLYLGTTPVDITYDLATTLRAYNTTAVAQTQTSDIVTWKNADIYTSSLEEALDFNPTSSTDSSATATPVPTKPAPYLTEFVTIKSNDGTSLRLNGINAGNSLTDEGTAVPTADTVYLLRVPFRLKAYPPDGYVGEAITLHLTEQTFVMGATENGVTNSASWEGVDKTTAVNNAKNHFDSDVEIVDIFDTNGKNYITGTLKGWDPSEPFKITLFKRGDDDNPAAPSPVLSDEYETDSGGTNYYKYGFLMYSPKGEVEWNFRIPISNQFDYRMVIEKQSHITYPDIYLVKETPLPSASPDPRTYYLGGNTFTLTDPIELLVGDTDGDGYIKDPDRSELIRYYYQQKPWLVGGDKWRAADMNGDGAVNDFDMYLWRHNIHAAYEDGGGGAG